jgi:phosphotransferase system enzyme I (PtsI)
MMTFANASMLSDVQQAMAVRADGIGLFRTEISFIRAERLLSEDEQYSLYAEIVRRVEGRPVTFRLLDIGGDKELPFLKIPKESNPFLGLRGARFLLESSEVFSTQMKALARLSKKDKARVLFPMVIDTVQLDKLLAAARDVIATVEADAENIEFGAMFEVPSACLQAESIMKKVAYASIGSNDLIQYLFAVDRNNESVSEDYNPEHPALWDVLALLSDTAKKTDTPLSICGEMAGREGMPSRLLDIGISALSVSPRLVPRVRNEMAEYVKNSSRNSVLSS